MQHSKPGLAISAFENANWCSESERRVSDVVMNFNLPVLALKREPRILAKFKKVRIDPFTPTALYTGTLGGQL